MKKIATLICTVLAVATLNATPVDPATARKAATNFIRATVPAGKQPKLTDITAATPFRDFYVFAVNTQPHTADREGFVLVAGDKSTEPILGYSLSGAFPTGDLPPHVLSWLRNYEKEIAHNRKCEPSKAATEQWDALLGGTFSLDAKASVEPMITTTWNQSPYYNELCPYDSAGGGRAVCGCTATATAQIMKYFNHPQTGYGSCTHHHRLGDLFADYGNTTYLWDSMPTFLGPESTAAEVDAVATIIYHVGVAVSMDYNYSGSGGKTASYGYGGEASSENAFKYNFKYSPYVWTAFRIDYDLNGWKALMKQELNAGRPILYAGYDELQAGHAFVLDGYNSAGLYHFNWGWGGWCDGFYKLNDLNPRSETGPTGYHFDLFATATIGIEPFSQFGEATTTVTATAEGASWDGQPLGSVSGSGSYNFGDTITMMARANNEWSRFVQWSDGCKYNPRRTVATGGELSFTAQFEPVKGDRLRYYTSDNAMNRASNIPAGLAADSVWGIKLAAMSLQNHHDLTAVRFMGRYVGTHTLYVYTGDASPSELLYRATFVDSLAYPFSFYTHTLSEPVAIDATRPVWIVLKCTDVDTPAVFSLYGGNSNSMLVGSGEGEDLHPWVGSDYTSGVPAPFSWMIEGIFTWDGTPGAGVDRPVHAEAAVSVYPNPSSGAVSVSTSEPATVEICDMMGRKIFNSEIRNSKFEIQNSRFPTSGIYIVTARFGNGTTATTKLVVK